MLLRVSIIALSLSLSACSNWIYRIDIPQGNYLEQKAIDQLQVGMTKEQVKFVLGSPVIVDTFKPDIWHYVYEFNSGKDKNLDFKKKFILTFEDEKLKSAEGDFEVPESFYTPIQNDA